jgi:hypothetical protein
MDYILSEQFEEIEEAKEKEFLYEVAMHISNGMSRENAKEHVRQLDYLRSEAEKKGNAFLDENGFVIGYAESALNEPSIPIERRKQVHAIYQDLLKSEL